jgi:Tfp pilus assembly protein PilN
MLRTNLSTRPFYNERAVHAVAALVAIAVLAITAWQVLRIVRLSRYKTELNASITRDRREADAALREAQQIRRGLDQTQLATLAAGAREAHDLIARRTFSWTALFNELEATLPEDVMLVAVRPEISDDVTQVQLDVQGKSEDDIQAFWERLEKTGRFHDASWSNTTITPEGYSHMAMTVIYTPAQAAARPAAAQPAAPAPPAHGGRR